MLCAGSIISLRVAEKKQPRGSLVGVIGIISNKWNLAIIIAAVCQQNILIWKFRHVPMWVWAHVFCTVLSVSSLALIIAPAVCNSSSSDSSCLEFALANNHRRTSVNAGANTHTQRHISFHANIVWEMQINSCDLLYFSISAHNKAPHCSGLTHNPPICLLQKLLSGLAWRDPAQFGLTLIVAPGREREKPEMME